MAQSTDGFSFDELSIAERILIVEQIWDSIAAESDQLEVTQAQRDELDRRLADYQASPSEGVTWEQLKARLQGAP
jgi:putative addiction module component (TIGR02574 family)